jgi:dienelactone hydrolase
MHRLHLLLPFAVIVSITAQTPKQPPAPADYGQWETLVTPQRFGGASPEGGGLSPDGKWLAYGITRSNGNNELRVANIADSSVKTTAFGTQPVFSSDSKWVAFSIGYSEAQQDKMRKDKKPVENKLGLLNLATGQQTVVDAIVSFAFSPDGTWLAMRKYPPEKAGGAAPSAAPAGRGGRGGAGGGGEDGENSAGATVIVRQLSSGRDTSFGNVADFAWQDLKPRGHLLAMTISTEDKTGNAVQLFDAATASLRVLDSAPSVYSDLAWRKDSSDLAVLRAKPDDKHDGPTSVALAWKHLGETSEAASVYDPTTDTKFPTGMRTVTYRRPSWSDDGAIVFLGYAPWYDKPPAPRRGGRGGAAAATEDAEDEQPDVDIWHWRDIDVMAKQKKGATQDGHRNMMAAWFVATGKFVPLGAALTEQVTPIKHHALGFVTDWKGYDMDRTIGRPAADLYLVDLTTGARTKIKEHILEDHYVQASPGGRYLIFLLDDNYWTVNTETRAVVNITKTVKSSFVDLEADHTIKQKPPFGVAGWTKNDAAVILYDKLDLWQIAPDGSRAVRLTDGAADQLRHRLVRLDRLESEDDSIDTDKPLYLSLFGIWSKKSGYARLTMTGGTPHEERLLLADKSIERLAKAKDADVYAYVSETFEESPNEFVGGPDLKDAKQATNTNPFQGNYAWSKSQLIEYKSPAGVRLQASLYYPAGYQAGKKYPMIVYMYEKLSDGLHRYNAPSERSYYSASAMTSHGYFRLEPDIVFRKREPGLSVQECVETAVKKAFELNVGVDEKKVGVIGHSWGGFDAAFLATHSNLFTAAVAGAPITDLVSNYGNHHWSSGIAETDHIETGQQRMEVPLYEDLQAYIRNSAIYNAQNMTVPLMIEVGDADGTVFYHQGVELYNIARRAKKNVVMLVYGGEDHGLRKKADQVDYQHRIFEWFGYYLKGDPAASWITNGQSYLDHQRELKKVKGAGTTFPE